MAVNDTTRNGNHTAGDVEIQAKIAALLDGMEHPEKLLGIVEKTLAGMGKTNPNGRADRRPFTAGLCSADKVPAATVPDRLWMGLYARTVVLFIGETGAGKSSLLYNLAVHAARNETLYDIPFSRTRPLRVLYVDPENSGSWEESIGGLCATKLERINQGKPASLLFHDGRGLNLMHPVDMAELTACIKENEIDLCILDPISNLFHIQDENDNSEAARQMGALTTLSRETGACVLCCHHTGKDTGGNYGRGASARLGAADVGMVFRARSDEENTDDEYKAESKPRADVCRLQIVKNRLEGKGSLFLQMAGEDRFERVDFQAWKNAEKTVKRSEGGSGITQAESAEEEIGTLMMDGAKRTRKEIIRAMRDEGIGETATDDALHILVKNKVLRVEIGPRNVKSYELLPPPEPFIEP